MPRKTNKLQQQIDALLRFLPGFEATGAQHGKWHVEDGVMPFLHMSDAVNEFVETLYESRWVKSFDWRNWQDIAEQHVESPNMVAQADVDTIR